MARPRGRCGTCLHLCRTSALEADAPAAVATGVAPQAGAAPQAPPSRLGDLSRFRTITQDALGLVNGGDQAGATARAPDLETAWDAAEARLKPRAKAAWTALDKKIDTVLRAIRATSPDPTAEKAALVALLDALGR